MPSRAGSLDISSVPGPRKYGLIERAAILGEKRARAIIDALGADPSLADRLLEIKNWLFSFSESGRGFCTEDYRQRTNRKAD